MYEIFYILRTFPSNMDEIPKMKILQIKEFAKTKMKILHIGNKKYNGEKSI